MQVRKRGCWVVGYVVGVRELGKLRNATLLQSIKSRPCTPQERRPGPKRNANPALKRSSPYFVMHSCYMQIWFIDYLELPYLGAPHALMIRTDNETRIAQHGPYCKHCKMCEQVAFAEKL